MRDQLAGKTVFVTGAAGLLGSTYTRRMLDAGAHVLATDLEGHRSDALISTHADNPGFRFERLDVNDESQVEGIFQRLSKVGWEPNVVLNNAAITGELLMGAGKEFPELSETTLSDWNRTLQTNLTGAFLIAREMDRDVVGKYPSTLINVASMYALNGPHHGIYEGMPFRSFPAYSASKAGIHGLTVWLAGYWARRRTTVNTLAPGAVFNGHSDEFQRRIGGLAMSGRMAQPDEIADTMLFLCSAQANYITGQMINVDGGFSAW